MPRPQPQDSDSEDLGELIDTTAPLAKKSKRTARDERRKTRRIARAKESAFKLLSLPYELILEILSHCQPSDIFRLARTHKALHTFIWDPHNQHRITTAIVSWRYRSLLQSYRLPIPLSHVDESLHDELTSPERKELLGIHRRPYYQHIPTPDPGLICTCLTCMLRWNVLCIAIDFAHWQDHLDEGTPIPILPRGKPPPDWNTALLARNAAIVEQALSHPLWHARILEAHLESTVRAIRRHAANKGNQRKRFEMSAEDVRRGDDAFLEGKGPASWELPFHRDNYYMLEAYVPNRSWVCALEGKEAGEDGGRGEEGREEGWRYLPEEMHERDLIWVERRAEERRRKKRIEAEEQQECRREKDEDERNDRQAETGVEVDGMVGDGNSGDGEKVEQSELDDAAVIEEVLAKAMKLNLVDTTIYEPRESIFGS